MVIGSAYGIKKIKINYLTILTISIITTFVTFLSMIFGHLLIKLIPNVLANLIGSITIILLGLYFTISSIKLLFKPKNKKEIALKNLDDMMDYAENSDKNCSGDICFKESVYISLALSINNVATGIAVYLVGIEIYLTLTLVFIFSIINLRIGFLLGNKYLGKILGKIAPLFAGILLIILGILEIVILRN